MMKDNTAMAEAQGPYHVHSPMLSRFEEIALTFLNMLNGQRESGQVFASLQSYLDGYETIDTTHCKRRKVLLTLHDMKEEHEAPAALQSRTLAKVKDLNLQPIPQVRYYRDIATALLKMEVVLRLEVMQQLVRASNGLSHLAGSKGRLVPALTQSSNYEPLQKAVRHSPN